MSKALKEDYIIRIRSLSDPCLGRESSEKDVENVELMSRGSFVRKGGSYYITYKETETTGYAGCVVTIKLAVDGSRAAILRFSRSEQNMQLLIEKGRRNVCHYEMGMGSMTMGVTADEIVCNLNENGGTASVSYLLDANISELISRVSLEITVTPIN